MWLTEACLTHFPQTYSEPANRDRRFRKSFFGVEGRMRGSRKVAVEECLAFDITDLTRAGVFKASLRLPCNCIWSNASGQEIFRMNFWLEGNALAPYLIIEYKKDSKARTCISSKIELCSVLCHFGGARRMFRCPGKEIGPCCRPVQKLYLIDGKWLCRSCGNLTYLAQREHDRRKDFLIWNPRALQMALESQNPRERLLALGAYVQAAQRLRKHMSRG